MDTFCFSVIGWPVPFSVNRSLKLTCVTFPWELPRTTGPTWGGSCLKHRCKSTIVWMMCRNVLKLHIHHHQLQTHATGLQRWGLKQHNFRFCFFCCFQAIISGELVVIFDEFRVSPYQKIPKHRRNWLAPGAWQPIPSFPRLLGIACTNGAMEPMGVEGKEPTRRWRCGSIYPPQKQRWRK